MIKLIKRTKYFSLIFIFPLLFFSGCTKNQPTTTSDSAYEIIDVENHKTIIPHKPKRILSLSLYTDEILLGLVHTERIVALNKYLYDPIESTVLEKAKKIKNKVESPSLEQVLSWRPDLIIATQWSSIEEITAYRDLGIPVIICNKANSYEEIQNCISLIAAAVDEKEKGQHIISTMNQKIAETKQKLSTIAPKEKKRVLLLSVMTNFGGEGSAFDDMCKYAGVINSISEIGLKNGQTLTKEMIIKANPDIIFLPNYNNNGTFDTKSFIDHYLNDPSLQTITAIKKKQLYTPRDYYIYNYSQDFVYGVNEIAYYAYGDKFKVPDGMNISFSGE